MTSKKALINKFVVCVLDFSLVLALAFTFIFLYSSSDSVYINMLSNANSVTFDYKMNNGPVKTVTVNKNGTSSDSDFNGISLKDVLQSKVLGNINIFDYSFLNSMGGLMYRFQITADVEYQVSFNGNKIKDIVVEKTTQLSKQYKDSNTYTGTLRKEYFSNFIIK